MNGELVRCVNNQRDLGVITDEMLKIQRQCTKVAKSVKPLEVVQRRSAKFLECLKNTEYDDKVQLLNPDSSSCRMDKGDMILVYEMPHGFLEGVPLRDLFCMAAAS